MCVSRKRDKLYRKYLVDIWGEYSIIKSAKNKNRPDDKKIKYKTMKYFFKIKKVRRDKWKFQNKRLVYQLKTAHEFNLPNRIKKRVRMLKLFQYFYLHFTRNTLIKWFNYAKKGKSYFITAYLESLEGNLMMLVYRLNFFSSLFNIPFEVTSGDFFIDFLPVTGYHVRLKMGQIFGVNFSNVMKYKYKWVRDFKKGLIYQKGPKNIFSFYLFLLFMFRRSFHKDDFINPIKVDVLRVHDIFTDYR